MYAGDEWVSDGESTDDFRTYGAAAVTVPDTYGAPFIGQCDGCPGEGPTTVRRVSGDWGTSVVCDWHAYGE